jgi:hypothetical protein
MLAQLELLKVMIVVLKLATKALWKNIKIIVVEIVIIPKEFVV